MSEALAAPEVVVVASSEATFRAALQDALAPTGMEVVAVGDEPPSVAELSVTARAIADREHASSTVWLIAAADKTTLVAYDRDVDRVLVREVPYVIPLTAAQAAEIARMARTMLRALRVTPELDLPLPRVAEARVERSRVDVPAVARVDVAPIVRVGQLAISGGGGVRVGAAANDAGIDGRLGVCSGSVSAGLADGVCLALAS